MKKLFEKNLSDSPIIRAGEDKLRLSHHNMVFKEELPKELVKNFPGKNRGILKKVRFLDGMTLITFLFSFPFPGAGSNKRLLPSK